MVHSLNPSDSNKRINPKDLESFKDVSSSKTKMSKDQSVNKNDEVILSSVAKDIQTATKNLGGMPADRLQRIKDLEVQLAKGTYHVDASEIAKKMIKEQK